MKIITQTIISDYKNYLINEEKSSVTIEKYVRDVLAFYDWIQGKELTKIAVLEYKAMLIENYAPASVNSILSSLNSFFDYNEWFDLKVKSLKVQRQMFCKSETELSKAEYERLLRAAKDKRNERLYLVMQTICSTGIRVSEIKYITKEAVINGQAQVKLKGKIRTVFIPKELCKILKKYITEQKIESGAVFVTRTGKPLDRHSIWKSMKQLCEMANVSKEKVFPHNLRHPYVKLKLKNSFNFCRRVHTEVFNLPYYLNSFIGINKHFINERIG